MRSLRLALTGLLAGLLAAVGLVSLTTAPAHACSCVPGGTAQHLRWSDAAFTGTLAEIDEPPPAADGTISSGDPVTYWFEVDRVYEGEVRGSTIPVVSARFSATCGLTGMQVDTRYLVFATADGDLFESGLCSGTAPVAGAPVDRVAELTRPAPFPWPPLPGWLGVLTF